PVPRPRAPGGRDAWLGRGRDRVHDLVSCRPRGGVRPGGPRPSGVAVLSPARGRRRAEAGGRAGARDAGAADDHRAWRRGAVPRRAKGSPPLSKSPGGAPAITVVSVPYTPARPDLAALGLCCVWIFILSLPMWTGQLLAGPNSDQYITGYAIRFWGAMQWRATGHPPQWNPLLMYWSLLGPARRSEEHTSELQS